MQEYLEPSGPQWNRSALLTIDVQNDFVLPSSTRVFGTLERIPAISRLVQAFRESQRPIVHAVRLYEADGSNAEPCRRRSIREQGSYVVPNSKGAELVADLNPNPDCHLDSSSLYAGSLQEVGALEWAMYKPRWDAFYATRLEEHLHIHDINTLVVCGCNLPNCPRATLFGASARDFHTFLIQDATSQVTSERLFDLSLIGTIVLDVERTIQYLRNGS
jgi:nicotinamidase-related amidase